MINITSQLFIFEPYKGISHTTVALNVSSGCDHRTHDVLFIYCNYCILNISFTIYRARIFEESQYFFITAEIYNNKGIILSFYI